MKHLVLVTTQIWSHARSQICGLASLTQHSSKLFTTAFIPDSLRPQTEAVLAEYALSAEQQKRLRLVYLDISKVIDATGGQKGLFFEMGQLFVDEHYDAIMAAQSVGGFEAISAPTSLIVDMWCHPILDHHLAKCGENGVARLFWLGIEGGNAIMNSAGWASAIGGEPPKVLELPGITPAWTYEANCCTLLGDSADGIPPAHFVNLFNSFSKHRMLFSSSKRLWPGIEQLVHSTGNHFAPIGYPPSFWSTDDTVAKGDSLFQWLDKQKKQSVIYVSFGSLFFPCVFPWQVTTLVDSLIASGSPFVFVQGALQSNMMDQSILAASKQKVEASGNFWNGFCDQQSVLRHPAISIFLSHAGPGSMYESLISGVPLIAWPMTADQPADANSLERLGACVQIWEHRDKLVGKEIASKPGYQVKCTPESLREELDCIFKLVNGPAGQELRANAEKAGQLLRDEHDKHFTEDLDEVLALL